MGYVNPYRTGATPLESTNPTVSVVIPTLNEAKNLPHVLPRLPSCVDELIIVDGHSNDATIAVARRLWPDVVVVEVEALGKGNALTAGFEVSGGDIIVMLDADGSTDVEEIPRFIDALVAGADFVKGSRYVQGGGSDDLSAVRRFGNRVLTRLVNVLFGTEYTDLCYGYAAFWKSSWRELDVNCPGFEIETLLNIRAKRAGLSVAEVPSFEHSRIHGTSNLDPVADGLRILRTIVAERLQPFVRLAKRDGKSSHEAHR